MKLEVRGAHVMVYRYSSNTRYWWTYNDVAHLDPTMTDRYLLKIIFSVNNMLRDVDGKKRGV